MEKPSPVSSLVLPFVNALSPFIAPWRPSTFGPSCDWRIPIAHSLATTSRKCDYSEGKYDSNLKEERFQYFLVTQKTPRHHRLRHLGVLNHFPRHGPPWWYPVTLRCRGNEKGDLNRSNGLEFSHIIHNSPIERINAKKATSIEVLASLYAHVVGG